MWRNRGAPHHSPLDDEKESQMDIILPEAVGTFLLVLLGCGVVANVVLAGTKGFGGGWLLINFGWGLGVFAGVYAAVDTGAHINPAVTFGLWAAGGDLADRSEEHTSELQSREKLVCCL